MSGAPVVRFHLAPGSGPAPLSPAAAPAEQHMDDEGEQRPKQGCVDACLGRSATLSPEEAYALRLKKKQKRLKPGEEPRKRFYFRLDKIVATFDTKMEQAFLEFEFGGQYQERTSDGDNTVTAFRTIKGPDGKDTKEEYQKRVVVKKVDVLKPRAAIYFTRMKRAIKAKTDIAFHDHSFEGYWEGPYSDLARESLTIRLWYGGGYTDQNTLVGKGSEPLSKVVDSKMDREVRLNKYVPGAGLSTRKETMARIRYKLEFQEDYPYNILFKNWNLNRREEPIYPDTEPVRWCCVHAGKRQLSFEIMQSRQSVFASMSSSLRAYLWPCAAQRWENRCDLPVNKEGDSGNQAGVIRYAGTRAWLEDESLSITLSKKVCCCIPVTIGHKAAELQGVLDSGQIETTIDVAENMNALTCISQLCYPLSKQPFQVGGTINSSSFVEGDNLPRYRQAGNADPTGAGLLSAGESHTLLVVKVILAKGLSIPSREDFKEHLNPTVSVHWNGMQKSTREVHNSADPFWDQEVHFKLMDRDNPRKKAPKKYEDFSQTARDSRVELMVWDKEGLASRTALGKCHVDFYDIYYQRKAYGIITATSNGRKVERLVYRSGPMPLETPFATDGAERKKNAGGERSAGGMVDNKKDDFSTRYIEFLCYFDRTDTNPVPLLKKGREGRDAAAIQQQDYKHIDEPLSAASIKSGRAFWDLALKDVKDRQKRFFPFYGIDELSGTYHFLPTFLKRVNPPAEIHSIGALMFFISSIEFTKKPAPWIDPLKDSTPAVKQGDIWQWADPFFFLERRRGDTKDHAIALCNWLLGLGLDAYVCVGTARPRKGAAPRATAEPHCWVMTREEDDGASASDSAASAAASSPPGGASIGPSYFIRFWEPGAGRTYRVKGIVTEPPANLKPKRYLEEPDIKPPPMDEEEFRRQREKQAEMAKQAALGLGLDGDDEHKQDAEHADADGDTADGEEDDDGHLAAASSSAASSKKPVPAPRVIDGAMRARLSAAELQSIELENRAVALDASLDDPDENVSDLDLLQLTSNLAREEARLRSGPDAHAKAKEMLDEKSDMESVRSVFDEKKLALVAQERALRLHQQKLVADLEDPTLKQQKKQLGRQCPYASIDLVFNHKHLYANLGVSDPELAFFDFERHPERWCEFQETQYRQYLGIHHLKPFYPDRGLAAVKAPQRDAEEVEDELVMQLKQTIATHRKYPADNVRPSMDTEFLQRFEFQAEEQAAQGQGNNPKHTAQAYLMQRLDHEQLVALQPKELRSLQKRLKESTPNVDYDYVDRVWRPKIVNDLPPGYVYRERCHFFKHCDKNRITTKMMELCAPLIEFSEFRKPRFGVACQLYRMPAQVCPVRVLVIVIVKEE